MTKFKEDYFIVQDEESCAFLFRKEDIEKYIQIENIKSAINGSDKHILINGYDQQTIFYFDFSPVNY